MDINNLGLDANTLSQLSPQDLEVLRQYGMIQSDLQPMIAAGSAGIPALMAGAGLTDNTQAIQDITGSASFIAQKAQGEDAMRQQAAASGQLNSGQLDVNLGQYTPQLLMTMLNDRYASLGNLVNMGQKATALGTNFGTSTGSLLSNQIMANANRKAGENIQSGANTAANIRGVTSAIGTIGGFF
jgi:hypothetical protein